MGANNDGDNELYLAGELTANGKEQEHTWAHLQSDGTVEYVPDWALTWPPK
jgi:hypothetical protein